MALRQKVGRKEHISRGGDERNVVRGHALFVRFMERKGLGDCIHYFPDTMTLGNLRTATQHELLTKYDIRNANDRERIMHIVHESHREDQSDAESDYSSSPKQSTVITSMPLPDEIPNRRSFSGIGAHLLQRTLSETVRHRRPDRMPAASLGKHLSCSQFGLNLSWNSSGTGGSSAGAHEFSNLVRIRSSSLGKSAPSLSTTSRDSTLASCCSTPASRRPSGRIMSTAVSRRSLIIPSSALASPSTGGTFLSLPLHNLLSLAPSSTPGSTGSHSPCPLLGSPLDSPRSASSASHSQFQFVTNKSVIENRRWSVASMASSGCPSNVSSQYSSQERLHYAAPVTPDSCPASSSASTVVAGKLHQPQFDGDGSNTPFGEELNSGDGLESSNGSSGLRSPLLRPRSQSLSSPARSPGIDSGTMLMNNVYRDRFPKAVDQMEEKLTQFIEGNQLDEVDAGLELDGAGRFIHHQVVELARDCLEKSRSKLISSKYFYELSDNLERLLRDAQDRSAASLGHITQLIRRLLMIVSRPARLLECLEFDPEEFYKQLEVVEDIAKQTIKTDIPRYIVSKLGLARDHQIGADVCSIDSGRPDTPDTDESSESHFPSNSSTTLTDKQSKMRQLMQKKQPCQEDFETIRLISNGAYGAVYLVRHRDTKQVFAMKKLLKNNLVLRNQVEQVFAERDILTFTDNPFVVSFYCSFETKKHLCMVLEYVEGGDCGALLKNIGGPLSFDLARMYFAETVLALEYLHSYGIVHRDLKPDNLLITLMGHIKLTDFGLSRVGLMNLTTNLYEGAIDKGCTQFKDMQVFGTPEYIAPEVILRQGYGKPVDWWSLGIILYEFLVGCVPFFGNTPEELFHRIINDDIEWPEEEEFCPPDDARDLILALLQRNPLQRLGTSGAQEVKEHEFFKGLDWDSLLRQKAEFIPHLQNEEDTSYFDTRCDRYSHDLEDDTEDDSEENSMFNSFSSCSPRYIKFEELRMKRNAESETSEGNSSTSSKVDSGADTTAVDCQDVDRQRDFNLIHSNRLSDADSSDSSSSKIHVKRDSDMGNPNNTSLSPIPVQSLPTESIAKESKVIMWDVATKEADGKSEQSQDHKKSDDGIDGRSAQSTMQKAVSSAEQKTDTESAEYPPVFSREMSHPELTSVEPLVKIRPKTHLRGGGMSSIPKLSISIDDGTAKDIIPAEDKEKEEQDKLGPLRPLLATSKSAPSMPAVAMDSPKDQPPASVVFRCISDMTKSVPRSASTSLLSLASASTAAPATTSMTAMASPLQVVERETSPRALTISPSSGASSRDGSPPPYNQSYPNVNNVNTAGAGTGSGGVGLLKPSIVIRRGPRGYGFTLRAIRVYYGESVYYTLHHLVVAVEQNSPAMDAGLRAGDLITHVNGTSVQGLLHIELVRLILTGGSCVTLCTVPLESTSIRLGARKVAGASGGGIGYAGMPQACTLPSRHRRRPNDDRRRRSSLFRQLSNKKAAEQQLTATSSSPLSPHRLSVSSTDSLPNSPTTSIPSRCQPAPNVASAVEAWMCDSAHSTENSSSQSSSPGSSAPGSPAVVGSPSPMVAVGGRPSTLHGLKHKLQVTRPSNVASRRKSWHNNPLSPLVRTPSPSPGTATSPTRSPSPLTTVSTVAHHRAVPLVSAHVPGISNMAQLYNPAQPQSGIGLTGSSQVRKSSGAVVTEAAKLMPNRMQSPERRVVNQHVQTTEPHRRSMTGPLERTLGLTDLAVGQEISGTSHCNSDGSDCINVCAGGSGSGGGSVVHHHCTSGYGSIRLQTGPLRIDVGPPDYQVVQPSRSDRRSFSGSPSGISPLVAVDIHHQPSKSLPVEASHLKTASIAHPPPRCVAETERAKTTTGVAQEIQANNSAVRFDYKHAVANPVPITIRTGAKMDNDDASSSADERSVKSTAKKSQ